MLDKSEFDAYYELSREALWEYVSEEHNRLQEQCAKLQKRTTKNHFWQGFCGGIYDWESIICLIIGSIVVIIGFMLMCQGSPCETGDSVGCMELIRNASIHEGPPYNNKQLKYFQEWKDNGGKDLPYPWSIK